LKFQIAVNGFDASEGAEFDEEQVVNQIKDYFEEKFEYFFKCKLNRRPERL
jgi:hypothetical protein